MKKQIMVILAICLIATTSVFAQDDSSLSKKEKKEIERQVLKEKEENERQLCRAHYTKQLEQERALRQNLSKQVAEVDSVEIDTTSVDLFPLEREYRKILSVRFNKNKGYKNLQAFEMPKYSLLEKGVSYASFNLSFESLDIDNLWLEPIAIIDYSYYRNIGANISGGYMIKDNIALGAKFSYSFTDLRLEIDADILDILIGADSYATNNATTIFSGSFLVKNFIPIDRVHRLFLISETNIGYANTHSLAKNYYGGDTEIHKVETQKNSFFLGLSPGFMYFMSRGFAFEFSLSPVVAYYTKTTKINNEVQDG